MMFLQFWGHLRRLSQTVQQHHRPPSRIQPIEIRHHPYRTRLTDQSKRPFDVILNMNEDHENTLSPELGNWVNVCRVWAATGSPETVYCHVTHGYVFLFCMHACFPYFPCGFFGFLFLYSSSSFFCEYYHFHVLFLMFPLKGGGM